MLILLSEYILPILGSLLLIAGITLIAELPFFLGAFGRERYSLKYKLGIFILINIITSMIIMVIWLGINFFFYDAFEAWIMILLGVLQIVAALAEAFVYRKAFKTGTVKTLVISFMANALSAAAVMFVVYQFEL